MNTISNWLTRTAAAVVLLVVPMTYAEAQRPTPIDLGSCQVTDVSPTADACAGYIDNANDFLGDPLFVNSFDGGVLGGGWTFDSKTDINDDGTQSLTGNGNITVTTPVPASSGDWLINNIATLIANFDDAMIVLKASNGFNAYLFEMFGMDIETGEWTMYVGNDDPRELKDISHISLYLRGDGGDIPLPATIGMLGIGLIGLGAGLARRRRG